MGYLLVILVLILLWDVGWAVVGLGQTPPWTLKKRLAQGDRPLMVDVRTPTEYAWFHIPGAVNLPYGSPGAFDQVLDLTRKAQGRDLVIICMTGHRSPLTAYRLAKMGVRASNLTWGMVGWKLFSGETVSGK